MLGPDVKVQRAPVATRIAALRSRIAAERENSRLLALGVAPRLNKAMHVLAIVRRLPALVMKYSPVVLPLASVVFKRNRTIGWAMRSLGFVRLGRSLAAAVHARLADRAAVTR